MLETERQRVFQKCATQAPVYFDMRRREALSMLFGSRYNIILSIYRDGTVSKLVGSYNVPK